MLSGPWPVTFGDTEDVNTTAKFSQPGQYVIQLRADDGMMTVSDNVTITVKPGNRLSGGEAHTLVVDNNRKAWSCGPNRLYGSGHSGSLLGVGDDTSYNELFLTQVHGPNGGQLQNMQAVAAGAVHSLALESDRNVWSWGDNTYGELGIGVADYKNVPVEVRTCNLIYDPCQYPDSSGMEIRFKGPYNANIDALHVAGDYIYLSTDNTATLGQGAGTTFKSCDIVKYDPDANTAEIIFDGNACGLSSTDSVDAIHVISDNNVILSTRDGGTLGGVTFQDEDLVKVTGDLIDANAITAELFFVGNACCPGDDDFIGDIDAVHILSNGHIIMSGQVDTIIDGTSFKNNALIKVEGDNYIEGPVTATLYFQQGLSLNAWGIDAVSIIEDGGPDIIFSTAKNDDMLGELSFKNADLVKCAVQIDYLKDVLDIAAGRSGRHSLAVKNDGSVWAWGMNDKGQVGNDKSDLDGDENVFVPVQVFGHDTDEWGDPGYGDHDPDEGYLKNITAVAAGVGHSVALEKLNDANDNCNGSVYTWGAGASGQLGTGYSTPSYIRDIPVKVHAGEQDPNYDYYENVTYLRNIITIAVGWRTTAALEKLDPCDPDCNGRVYTWGTVSGGGNQGLLGDGEHDSSELPIIVCAGQQDPNHPADPNYPLKEIVAISAGEGHFMALDLYGRVWTWGSNKDPETGGGPPDPNSGHLGSGTWDDANTPVRVVAPDRDRDSVRDDLNGDSDPNNDYLGDDIPIIAISAGYWHSLAMDAHGTIYSWGYGGCGRLGIGSEDNKNIPQVVIQGARVHNLDKDTWYSTIQQAINDADDGDTLVANEGTYYENIEFHGKTLKLTSTDPNDWDVVSNTIIDSANRNYDVVTPGTGSNSTITGFTITHGAIGINSANASATIRNNFIKDNFSHGIYCESGTFIIEDNWITGNNGTGVNLSIAGTGTLVANNTVVHNSYGIDSSSNTVDVINCILWQNGDNTEEDNIYGSYNSVDYCAIGGDYSTGTGNFDPCDPCFVNPYDFVDKTTNDGTESTIEVADASKYDVNDVIEIGWDGDIRTVNDVDLTNNIITFEPNLSSPTLFDTPLRNWGIGATDIYEDWHITADSNCKNAGDPSGDYTGKVDIDGQPRKLLGNVDVGADEYAPLSIDAGPDKQAIIGQKLSLADADFMDDPCDTQVEPNWIWSSAPDTNVIFDSNTVVDTNVTFYDVGIYTLHLDGYKDYGSGDQLAGADTLTVTVNPWAGADKILYWPDNHADLTDANASGADSVEWVQFWGTADVEFVNDTNAFTLYPEVNLPDVGIYGLELLAKDTQGDVIGSDTIWISVLMQMVDVNAGSYPPVTLLANQTATVTLAGTVSGIVPSYTYWMGPESAVFADPCALDTQVTFTAPGLHPLELRAYTQDHQLIGAARTFITVYGVSVVDAGKYDSIAWPEENSVELAGRIVSGDPDWTQWSADANYVSFDDPCKLDAEATFSEPAVYQLRLTAYDNGSDIGQDDVWITVSPVTVNASLDDEINVDDGQITFPNKADLYALSPTSGSLPDGVSIVWETTSQYVTLDQSSGWQHATAEFQYPGSYYVALVARKDNDVTGWDIIHITVSQPQGVVDAGPDRQISLAQPTLQLSGTILGTEPQDVSYLWSWSSYEGPDPCAVTFDPNDAKDTNATFYTTGIYQLRFEVYAGDVFFGSDTVKIAVSDDNQNPIVKAGYKKMGVVNTPISLADAMVWDESDIADLTLLWQVDSSPPDSNVIFDPDYSGPNDSNQLNPDVTFDTVGPYTLKLTATDPCNNSGTGYLEVLIGTATQQTVISAGRDKTVILPDYSVHLHDAWVFPILEDNMTLQWTAPNIPESGYVGFVDLADTNSDPCSSISVLNPVVTFSQNGDGNDVATGSYVLELTLSIPNEPNNLTDRVMVTVENNDVSGPIITMFYAAIDGNSINNDVNLQGLIDILVVAEDEDLDDVTLELDESKILNPDNTEILEGTPQNIRKMRRTYSIHTSQISTDANYHTLTVTATDTADNNDTAQISFHIKDTNIVEPVARISGYKDEGASQAYPFAEEPNITVIGKGLFKLIGAAYDPNNPSDPNLDYKIELFTAEIGDAPVEYWNPTYKIYHDCFVKNLTGGGFVSGPVGNDSNDGVLAGSNPNLDLTGVENGSYQLLLTARAGTEGNYQYFQTHVGFVLDTQLKVGNVKFTQEDLVIPVGGIPLRVTRTYDSLTRNVDGAFGYGWTYSIADMDIELNEKRLVLTSATDWEQHTSVRCDSNYNRNVTLTLPNGQRTTFVFYLVPIGSQAGNQYAPDNFMAKYAAPPGVAAKLETKVPEIMDAFGFWSSVWGTTGALAYQDYYDFSGFVLTTEDGTKYYIERKKHIDSDYDIFWHGNKTIMARPCGPPYLSYIETRGGEKLSFDVSGPANRIDSIEHDVNDHATKKLEIEHDHGNIVKIWAPSEQQGQWPTLQYDYDGFGNLTKVHRLLDKAAAALDFNDGYQTTTYDYDDPCGVFDGGAHYIFGIKDERGLCPIMYIYDANGVLEAVRDARGNRIELSHDLGAKKEAVTDRTGNLKFYYYNDRGLVLTESVAIDSNEHILTQYTYDDPNYPDKPSAVADACDNTTYYKYDTQGRITEVNDPEGNISRHRYDNIGNILETRQYRPDAQLVNKTVNEYYDDYWGNPTSLLWKTQVADDANNIFEQTEYFYDDWNRITDVNKVDPNDDSHINITHYTYADDGNFPSSPNSVTDTAGFTQYFDYDENGNQIKSWYDWVDPNDAGRSCTVTTITEYDDASRVARTLRDVSSAQGGIQEYTIVLSETIYDAIGKPQIVYDQYDSATVYHYDESGNLVQTDLYDESDNLLTRSRTLYDAEGRTLVTVGPYDPCDPNARPVGTETVYDQFGRVMETARWADVDINLVDLVVDSKVVGKKVPNDATPDNAWDGTGTEPSNIGWTCDDGNLPVVGSELSYSITEYDAVGRVTMTISLDENGREWPTSYEYDTAGKQTAVIDPCGHDIERDPNGKLVSAEPNENLGHRTHTQYLGTRRWKVTDANDNTTEFKYDALGRVVKTIYPAVSPHGATYSHVGYDSLGRRTWQSEQTVYSDGNDPNIIGKEFEYDDTGRLSAVILPDVNDPCNSDTPTYPRYEYDYDKYGNLTCIRDNIKQYADDSIDYNDVRETYFTYGPLHSQVSRRLPDGRIEFKEYDNLGRLKKSTDFKAQITGYDYNARGLLEYNKFYANDTLYTYDEPNQLYQYSYDTLGRNFAVDVNDIDDANVDTYLYDYDDQGQITEVNTPQGTVYYDYNDITGRKVSTSTAETQVDYTYDHLGRLNTAKLVKRNGSTVSELTSYTYNTVGSRAGMTLPNGVTTDYAYDALNRLTHIAHANSVDTIASYTYTLGADGKRTRLAEILDRPSPDEPEDNIIDYTYDNLSRITREYADANGTSYSYQIDYEYSIIGNRLKRIVDAGSQTLTTRCEYDPNTDQLLKELHNGPEVAFIWQNRRVYAYAPHGRITHYQIQGRPGSIGPFKASILGLPSVWSRYIFIAVMALLAVAFFAPALMSLPWKRKSSRPATHLSIWRRCLCVLLAYVMLISPVGFETLARADTLYSGLATTDWHSGDRTIQYSYDNNGSVASKTTIETSDPNNVFETVTYEYNLQNRLEWVTREYTEDNNDIDEITEYTYNPDGIRVKSYYYKTINDGAPENEETKIFLIDSYNHTGYAQVLEQWSPEGTTPAITYTIGDDVISEKPYPGFIRKYLLYDGHGSVRQVVLHNETIFAAYSYDAYGVMLGGNPGTPQNPNSPATNLLYAGEHFDTHAQHYYNRARWYNPSTGLFNRMDDFAGSPQDPESLHKYLYCHANPANAIDPTGKFTLPEMLVAVMTLGVVFAAYGGAVVAIRRGTVRQVFDAQVRWFWLGVIIAGVLYAGIWATTAVLTALYGASAGFGDLEVARRYGIQSYNSLSRTLSGTGFRAHHIIEERFAFLLNISPGKMPSVALTQAEHGIFTRAWQQEIGYASWNMAVTTANATKQDVWMAAQKIYAECPALLDLCKTLLVLE